MQNQEKILLTINEFSRITGIGEKTARRLSHVRGFPALRAGRRIMIHRQAADKWLADCAAHQDNCLPSLH